MPIPISFASPRRKSNLEAANNDIASASALKSLPLSVHRYRCLLELHLIAPDSEFRKKQNPLVDFLSSNFPAHSASLTPVSRIFYTSVSYTLLSLDASRCVFLVTNVYGLDFERSDLGLPQRKLYQVLPCLLSNSSNQSFHENYIFSYSLVLGCLRPDSQSDLLIRCFSATCMKSRLASFVLNFSSNFSIQFSWEISSLPFSRLICIPKNQFKSSTSLIKNFLLSVFSNVRKNFYRCYSRLNHLPTLLQSPYDRFVPSRTNNCDRIASIHKVISFNLQT